MRHLREGDEDILSLIKSDEPSPRYEPVQKSIQACLANVSDRLLAIIGAPSTRKDLDLYQSALQKFLIQQTYCYDRRGNAVLNQVWKAVRVETLREIDIALITCASPGNQFFRKRFNADFVVMEDNPSELHPRFKISALGETSTQSLPSSCALCSMMVVRNTSRIALMPLFL